MILFLKHSSIFQVVYIYLKYLNNINLYSTLCGNYFISSLYYCSNYFNLIIKKKNNEA